MGYFFQNCRSIWCSFRGSMLIMALCLKSKLHGVSREQLLEAVGPRDLPHGSHHAWGGRRLLGLDRSGAATGAGTGAAARSRAMSTAVGGAWACSCCLEASLCRASSAPALQPALEPAGLVLWRQQAPQPLQQSVRGLHFGRFGSRGLVHGVFSSGMLLNLSSDQAT